MSGVVARRCVKTLTVTSTEAHWTLNEDTSEQDAAQLATASYLMTGQFVMGLLGRERETCNPWFLQDALME